MLKTSGSDIQETQEDTARIEISCSVKGYQECRFSVDVGEEFLIYKKIGSKGKRLQSLTLECSTWVTVWHWLFCLNIDKFGMKLFLFIPTQ